MITRISKVKYLLAASALGACLFTGSAQATFITANSINGTTINFDALPTAQDVLGQVQIGDSNDITVESSSNSNGLYFNYNGWGLVDNGTYGGGMTYVSLNGGSDSMIISFNDGPVNAVGGFLNYARYSGAGDLIISALDINMDVLESYNITQLADIITPNGFNEGAFRGITRGTADISFFEISGGLANTLDDLTYGSGDSMSVAEPGTLALVLVGLMGLGLRRRKS